MAPLNILIIGAGIAGPTLATFLLLTPEPPKEKPHITILERAPSVRPHGQNIDIRGAGVIVIRKLGLTSTIKANTTGEKGVQHVDAQNRVWAALEAGKGGAPTSDVEILRGRLAEVMVEKCREVSDDVKRQGGAGVDFVFGDYVADIEELGDKASVRFAESGETRKYDLVVGADGLQSRTRRMVWGKETDGERVKSLGMYGGFFSMPRGETDTEWRRWYHAPGRRGIMLRPDGTGKRTTATMTLVSEDQRLENAAVTGRGGVDAQKILMEEYYRGVGWESERVLGEMEKAEDFYYDMIAQVKMERWSKGRVVLLGDAGYDDRFLSNRPIKLTIPVTAPHPCQAWAQHWPSSAPTIWLGHCSITQATREPPSPPTKRRCGRSSTKRRSWHPASRLSSIRLRNGVYGPCCCFHISSPRRVWVSC